MEENTFELKDKATAEIDAEFLRNSEIRDGRLVRYYGKRAELVIPDSVASIAAEAFRGNRRLTRVVLGANVTVIQPNAFRDCVQLQQISLPTGLREIGDGAFAAVSRLVQYCSRARWFL